MRARRPRPRRSALLASCSNPPAVHAFGRSAPSGEIARDAVTTRSRRIGLALVIAARLAARRIAVESVIIPRPQRLCAAQSELARAMGCRSWTPDWTGTGGRPRRNHAGVRRASAVRLRASRKNLMNWRWLTRSRGCRRLFAGHAGRRNGKKSARAGLIHYDCRPYANLALTSHQ